MADNANQKKPVPICYAAEGDSLAVRLDPYLISSLFNGSALLRTRQQQPHLVAIGGSLESANRFSQVWGAGFRLSTSAAPDLRAENVHALRGKRSFDALRSCGFKIADVPLGDPAFLLRNRRDNFATETKYRIGLAAYPTDRPHPWAQQLLSRNDVLDLNVQEAPETFLANLAACETVISSSLHGLILAEAFDIPNVWIALPGTPYADNFRFDDWFSLAERPRQAPEMVGGDLSDSFVAGLVEGARLHDVKIDVEALVQSFPIERLTARRTRSQAPAAQLHGFNSQLLSANPLHRPSVVTNALLWSRTKRTDATKTPRSVRLTLFGRPAGAAKPPMVSCLMVTANRPEQARLAVECYRRQSWTKRNLVIVDNGTDDALEQWIDRLQDPSINFKRIDRGERTLGEIRNLAVRRARGDFICNWDDDDLHHPWRLEAQMQALKLARTEASFISRLTVWRPATAQLAVSSLRFWENSVMCRRDVFPRYAVKDRGEDTEMVRELFKRASIVSIEAPELYVYVRHLSNSWGDDHFDRMITEDARRIPPVEHDGVVARLNEIHPMHDYLDAIGF